MPKKGHKPGNIWSIAVIVVLDSLSIFFVFMATIIVLIDASTKKNFRKQ